MSPRSAIWSSTPSYRGTKPLEKQAVIERITHRDPLLVGHAAAQVDEHVSVLAA